MYFSLPQMAPMMWLMLMFTFNIMLIMTTTNIFFTNKKYIKSKFNNNFNKLIWKW